ncbi:MAG: hypothetical protein ACC707_11420, partial [Thiohalomonadales bacterium]
LEGVVAKAVPVRLRPSAPIIVCLKSERGLRRGEQACFTYVTTYARRSTNNNEISYKNNYA